ncbi:MAG: MFS transporter [Proteobacteria bacterium]|nr:MFS transporter [Pseudomonadota bacterium]
MIGSLVARYRAFLRLPDVTRILLFSFVARMPLGTATLALLLHVRALTGSFAVAGTAVGCYLGASAAAAPFLGRWIDRVGPHVPLLLTAVAGPLALAIIFFARAFHLTEAGLYGAALLAGAFSPPITPLMRTMLRQRFTDDTDRRMAFSLDAVIVEAVFTLGPLCTALLLTVASPRAAFGATMLFTLFAAPAFLASRALRYWHLEPDAKRDLLGPLTEPRLLAIFVLTFVITMTFGYLEVGYSAFGTAHTWQTLGPILIAVSSVGSAAGGLLYGGLHLATPPARMLPRLLFAMTVPLALHVVTDAPWAWVVWSAGAGLVTAPALTTVMLIVSELAPARYATEAFTWSATSIVCGFGLSAAVAGRIVEDHPAQVAFAVATCTIAVAALATAIIDMRHSSASEPLS